MVKDAETLDLDHVGATCCVNYTEAHAGKSSAD